MLEAVLVQQPPRDLEQGRRVEPRRERDAERLQSPREPPQVSRGFEEPAVPGARDLVHAVAEQEAPIAHRDGRAGPIQILAVERDDHRSGATAVPVSAGPD